MKGHTGFKQTFVHCILLLYIRRFHVYDSILFQELVRRCALSTRCCRSGGVSSIPTKTLYLYVLYLSTVTELLIW